MTTVCTTTLSAHIWVAPMLVFNRTWQRAGLAAANKTCPTAAVTCPHGGLVPDPSNGRSRRAVVSKIVMQFVKVCGCVFNKGNGLPGDGNLVQLT